MSKPLQDFFTKPLDPGLVKVASPSILNKLNIDIFIENIIDKPNAFKYNSDYFSLPLKSFNEMAIGKQTILSQMNELYIELQQSGNMVKLFLEHVRQYPLVADFIVKKRLVKGDYLLQKEYRDQIEWRTKDVNYTVLSWPNLFNLMKEMNLTHDEMLCHTRINIIRLNINDKIYMIERRLKYYSDMIKEMSQMDDLFNDAIPDWLEIK